MSDFDQDCKDIVQSTESHFEDHRNARLARYALMLLALPFFTGLIYAIGEQIGVTLAIGIFLFAVNHVSMRAWESTYLHRAIHTLRRFLYTSDDEDNPSMTYEGRTVSLDAKAHILSTRNDFIRLQTQSAYTFPFSIYPKGYESNPYAHAIPTGDPDFDALYQVYGPLSELEILAYLTVEVRQAIIKHHTSNPEADTLFMFEDNTAQYIQKGRFKHPDAVLRARRQHAQILSALETSHDNLTNQHTRDETHQHTHSIPHHETA